MSIPWECGREPSRLGLQRNSEVCCLFLMILPISPGPAAAQQRVEIHPLHTSKLTVQQALLGGKTGTPALAAGELRFPPKANGRIPAVIILPGGNGLTGSDTRWADQINGIGAAAFLVDSFAGRGLDPDSEPAEVHVLTMLVDAYRALEMLAQNPRIDPDRIAVMGFSMGAGAAVYAATQRFHDAYSPPGRQFAAHIGLYTPCYWTYLDDSRLTGKPVRLYHGIADDWAPIEPCREYVERVRKTGADITLTEYRGAHHGYASLDPSAPSHPIWFPNGSSLRTCKLVEVEYGVVLNSKTGKPFHLEGDPCFTKGAHAGRNPAAAEATLRAVKEFLHTTLHLPPTA